jgi:hypothetical protein
MAPVHGSIAPSDGFSEGGNVGGFDGEGSSDPEGNFDSGERGDDPGSCAVDCEALTS